MWGNWVEFYEICAVNMSMITTMLPFSLHHLELLEPFSGRVKDHHRMRCTNCGHEQVSTILAKTQAWKSRQSNACLKCKVTRNYGSNDERTTDLSQRLDAVGYDLLHVVGTAGRSSLHEITVRRRECGHSWKTNYNRIFHRNAICGPCNTIVKSELCKARNEARRKDPEVMKSIRRYRSLVRNLTKKNAPPLPEGAVRGRAGTPGAVHLDHIICISKGFYEQIDPEVIAHPDNLQWLPWLDNIKKRDH